MSTGPQEREEMVRWLTKGLEQLSDRPPVSVPDGQEPLGTTGSCPNWYIEDRCKSLKKGEISARPFVIHETVLPKEPLTRQEDWPKDKLLRCSKDWVCYILKEILDSLEALENGDIRLKQVYVKPKAAQEKHVDKRAIMDRIFDVYEAVDELTLTRKGKSTGKEMRAMDLHKILNDDDILDSYRWDIDRTDIPGSIKRIQISAMEERPPCPLVDRRETGARTSQGAAGPKHSIGVPKPAGQLRFTPGRSRVANMREIKGRDTIPAVRNPVSSKGIGESSIRFGERASRCEYESNGCGLRSCRFCVVLATTRFSPKLPNIRHNDSQIPERTPNPSLALHRQYDGRKRAAEYARRATQWHIHPVLPRSTSVSEASLGGNHR
ncbi:uncharacterized protein PAC_07627 [Phialocephala subalpina]|uniref:Uncharacterized protein n=1 Tax=Phialocephala subalpina TaxID=576137 RepID=A0A1L7WYA5_9HELO|nr:uncharacterized protein PAC_07627 [Phialocephala subalpina]